MKNIPWYQSLSFKALAGLSAVAVWLIFGILLIMEYKAKPFVEEESRHWVEQAGNAAVAGIYAYMQRVEGQASTLASAAEHLPPTASMAHEIFQFLLDAPGSTYLEGGGLWPDSYNLTSGREQRGFFWLRDENGRLRYEHDKQQDMVEYHHTKWYVASRYLSAGKCLWSDAEISLFSQQAVVTCTVPTYLAGKFAGAVTLNLQLTALIDKVTELQRRTGGYVFLTDSNNQFLTFPRLQNMPQPTFAEIMPVHEFAKRQPAFRGLAEGLEKLQRDNISFYRQKSDFFDIKAALQTSIRDLNEAEATVIAAQVSKIPLHWLQHSDT